MKICPTCGLRYPNEQSNCFVDRAKLEEAPDPHIGQLIGGRYRIEALLGEGGMATVYRARQTLQDKPVAIKLFRKELAQDAKLRERFRREATSAARLAHPNIIEINDSGDTEDGQPYLVMEYLVGESLEGLISHGRLPLNRAVDIILQMLGALSRAHDFQVIHRDLKPDNIFICRAPDGSDHVKILDFGIARSMHDPRLTGTGEVFGTPQYMAPERITTIDAGPSADIYAVGVMLFELCTGRLPFEANDVPGYLLKHMRDQPPQPRSIEPAIPPDLDDLILRLLLKDPAKRPVDAHAVVKELSAIAARLPRPKPVAMRVEAMPTPIEGVKIARPVAGTLAPATLERWQRRVMVFGKMLERAFPGGNGPPNLSKLLERVTANVAQMTDVRQRSMKDQARLEGITTRTREAQGRFGRAMDTLGQDLSRVRSELQKAREIEQQYAQTLKAGAGPFAALHARIVRAPPTPSNEIAELYRSALQALEQALTAEKEGGRAVSYREAKDREANDIDFQIQELRAQLERLSKASEDERAQVQREIETMGATMGGIEQALIQDASSLAQALRSRPDLADLFSELEADAA